MPLIGSILPVARNKLSYPSGVRPGFDPTHPASVGYSKGFFSGVSVGTQYIDIFRGKPAGTVGGTVTTKMDSVIGPSTVTAGAGNNYLQYSGVMPATAPVPNTLAAIFRPTTLTQTVLALNCGANLNGPGFLLTSAVLSINNWNATNPAASVTLTANIPYFAVASGGMASTGTMWLVVTRLDNGKIVSSSSAGVALHGAFDGNVVINNGANPTAGTASLAGATSAVMYAEAALTLEQLMAWAADPWSFWYPRPALNWVGKIAAAVNPFVRRNIIRAQPKGFR